MLLPTMVKAGRRSLQPRAGRSVSPAPSFRSILAILEIDHRHHRHLEPDLDLEQLVETGSLVVVPESCAHHTSGEAAAVSSESRRLRAAAAPTAAAAVAVVAMDGWLESLACLAGAGCCRSWRPE